MKSWFLFSLIFCSIRAFAGPDVSTWSYRYLARASNALLVASDQSLAKKEVICGIDGAKVSMLSQSLKALVDAKIKSLNPKQKSDIRTQAESCRSECTCDLYSYYFEQSSDEMDQKAKFNLDVGDKVVTTDMRVTCAKNFAAFCRSQLLKAISK